MVFKIEKNEIKISELMDDYILGRLTEKEKKSFEGHYLQCDKCFQALQSREKLINIINLLYLKD